MTALHKAVAQGNLAELERLLNKGANINARAELADTPLQAIYLGNK